MTGADILQRIWDHLGSNTLFYPEAEVIVNGINPAMRLLCLMKPTLLIQRVAVTVLAEQAFVNLDDVAPRHWNLRRVVIGTVTSDAPTLSTYGELYELPYLSLDMLSAREDWFAQRGPLQGYYRHGRQYLGLYKRLEADRTITLIYHAMPTAFTTNTMSQSPAFAETWHPLVSDIAAALLLLKEGPGQIDKARMLLTTAFGRELFGSVKERAGRQQRLSPAHVKTQEEVALQR